LKSDIQFSGFVGGLSCAFAGSVIFTLIEMVRFVIEGKEIDPLTYMLLFFSFFLLSFIPGGLGGTALGLLLQNQFRKGSLSPQSGTQTGILLWGLAGIITCVTWVWFAWRYPPHFPLESYNFNLRIFIETGIRIGWKS
jgi:hypothetical protein